MGWIFPLFLILCQFCANMSNDMYLPAFIAIKKSLLAPTLLIQLTITAWLFGIAAVQLWVGPVSAKYGRRPVLFGGGLLFLLATIGCAMAPDIYTFLFSRIFQGVGVCTIMVAGYACAQECYQEKQAPRILGWMGTAAIVAPAVGPIMGSYLLHFGNWRFLFWVIFISTLFSLIALWFSMPEKQAPRDTRSIDFSRVHQTYRQLLNTPPFLLGALSYGFLYGAVFAWITSSPSFLWKRCNFPPKHLGGGKSLCSGD